jgi:hypothetical protein
LIIVVVNRSYLLGPAAMSKVKKLTTRCRFLAKTLAASVKKYVEDKKITGLVFATCHDDFVPWLQPDWVFSTQTQELVTLTPSEPPEVR